jgi:hypothetical protein
VVELGRGEVGLRRAEVPHMGAWEGRGVCGVELDQGEVRRAYAPCRGARSLKAGSPTEPAEAVVCVLLLLEPVGDGWRWAAREQVSGA